MGFRRTQHGQIVRTGSGGGKKKVMASAAIVILLIGTNAGLFLWQQRLVKEVRREAAEERSAKEALEEKVETLESEVSAAQTESAAAEKANDTTANVSTIQSAFIHQDYAALQPHLAAQVMVILAASEGVGSRTPEQVPGDLAVLSSATAPWNFTVSEETLAEWRTGDYKQYFPEGAIVGRSANNYVIALQQNAAGKVTTIFISPDAALL